MFVIIYRDVKTIRCYSGFNISVYEQKLERPLLILLMHSVHLLLHVYIMKGFWKSHASGHERRLVCTSHMSLVL